MFGRVRSRKQMSVAVHIGEDPHRAQSQTRRRCFRFCARTSPRHWPLRRLDGAEGQLADRPSSASRSRATRSSASSHAETAHARPAAPDGARDAALATARDGVRGRRQWRATRSCRCSVASRALHAQSPFVHRLQTWPRGYPGDFETVEWLCDARNRAEMGTVPWAIEQCALQSPVAQQHRNKVGLQARAILSTIVAEPSARIASIGCGGCRDLSLIQDYIPPSHGRFALVDADADALAFARERLHQPERPVRAVQGRVPRVLGRLREGADSTSWWRGGCSTTCRIAGRSRRCGDRRLLVPGGRLLLSNIARGNPGQYGTLATARARGGRHAAAVREAGLGGEESRCRVATGLGLIVEARKAWVARSTRRAAAGAPLRSTGARRRVLLCYRSAIAMARRSG